MSCTVVIASGLMILGCAACFIMNAAPITSAIVFDPMTSIDLLTGCGHQLVSLVLFVLTLLMLFSADSFLVCATAPIIVQRAWKGSRIKTAAYASGSV